MDAERKSFTQEIPSLKTSFIEHLNIYRHSTDWDLPLWKARFIRSFPKSEHRRSHPNIPSSDRHRVFFVGPTKKLNSCEYND